MERIKRELSLDFAKPSPYSNDSQTNSSLVTPILAISTPELNKMIGGNDELTLLTPNGISSVIPPAVPVATNALPLSPLIPTTVNNCNNIMNNQNNENNSGQITDLNDRNPKHETRNRKSSRESGRADAEKIAKKRERNRLAAKKCRQRKIETIEDLRKKVSKLEQDNRFLKNEIDRYRMYGCSKCKCQENT